MSGCRVISCIDDASVLIRQLARVSTLTMTAKTTQLLARDEPWPEKQWVPLDFVSLIVVLIFFSLLYMYVVVVILAVALRMGKKKRSGARVYKHPGKSGRSSCSKWRLSRLQRRRKRGREEKEEEGLSSCVCSYIRKP